MLIRYTPVFLVILCIFLVSCGAQSAERVVTVGGGRTAPQQQNDAQATQDQGVQPAPTVPAEVPVPTGGDSQQPGNFLVGEGRKRNPVIHFWQPETFQDVTIYFEDLKYYKRSEAVEFNGFDTDSDSTLSRGKLHISLEPGIDNIPGEMVVYITCRDIDPNTGVSASNRRTLYIGVNAATKPGNDLYTPVGIAAHSFWYPDKKRDWGEPMRLIGNDAEKISGYSDDQLWPASGIFGIEHPSGTTIVYKFIAGVNVSFPEGKQLESSQILEYIQAHMAEIKTFVK